MASKELSTNFDIVGRGAKRTHHSACEYSSYISREKMYCEYTDETYYPEAKEDLVHAEVLLPEKAPREFADRAVLWNTVENYEDRIDAQLARTTIINMPNDWSYELAVEVVRDYIQRNFVDYGMCADFAIHDSENPVTHQRNLHFHLMLTMRPFDENGQWKEVKESKPYALDENGNRIPVIDPETGKQKVDGRNRKQWKRTKVSSTGWDSPLNASKWRKDWADTINKTNERIGLDEKWEHESFEKRGLDILPTKHVGARASALEAKGIATDRGDYNRWVKLQNLSIRNAAKKVAEAVEAVRIETAKWKATIEEKKNEILDMIDKVVKKNGILALPVVRSKYLAKIKNRSDFQKPIIAVDVVKNREWKTFDEVRDFLNKEGEQFDKDSEKAGEAYYSMNHNKELLDLYNKLKPLDNIVSEYNKLKGDKQKKFRNAHKEEIDFYIENKAKLDELLGENGRVTPKKWKSEIDEKEKTVSEYQETAPKTLHSLVVAEVILYNKKDLKRQLDNEEHQQTRSKNIKKETQNLE